MKVDLPLETWTDIFGFLPRSQLVQLSPHIWDRQFSTSLQFFLHKCGQITLGQVCIESFTNGDEHAAIVNRKIPLPDVPIPTNVNNFKHVDLGYYDQAVLGFIQELKRNSLLTNVNLYFWPDSNATLLSFLTNILPLLTSINLTDVYFNPLIIDEYSELVKPLLQSTRILNICLVIDTFHCAGGHGNFLQAIGPSNDENEIYSQLISCSLLDTFFAICNCNRNANPNQSYREYSLSNCYYMYGDALVEANFGDDMAKPFKYDLDKCPGMVFK